jgi:hypothetical protein
VKTDGAHSNDSGGILKLSCSRHHPLPGDEGRCLLCGRELDQQALTLRYRAAKRVQAELQIEAGRWIKTPWPANKGGEGGFGSRTWEELAA